MPDVAEFTTEQLLTIISEALKVSDLEAVSAALRLLAPRDPHAAELILAAINMAGSESDHG